MAIGRHMLIYADDVYKFPIASKGAYAIYFVFYPIREGEEGAGAV